MNTKWKTEFESLEVENKCNDEIFLFRYTLPYIVKKTSACME